MGHADASLMKLNKEDFVHLLLDYQGKFNSILEDLKNNFDKLTTKFTKLEADVNISRNVNSKLSYRLINVERKCFANDQHSRRECWKFQAFPLVSRIMNWRPKYSLFCKKSTPL